MNVIGASPSSAAVADQACSAVAVAEQRVALDQHRQAAAGPPGDVDAAVGHDAAAAVEPHHAERRRVAERVADGDERVLAQRRRWWRR